MDDSIILDLYFERNEEAITATKLKYAPRLYRTAMNILNNASDTEECVSDTLLKAWEVIPPTRPDFLGAYLAKTARNLAINKLKAKIAARRGGGETPLMLSELEDCISSPAEGMPERQYEAAQVTASINNCLKSMEKTMRIVFILRYFHGESVLSIANRLDFTESKIKSMLFRARTKLKLHLEKEGVSV